MYLHTKRDNNYFATTSTNYNLLTAPFSAGMKSSVGFTATIDGGKMKRQAITASVSSGNRRNLSKAVLPDG